MIILFFLLLSSLQFSCKIFIFFHDMCWFQNLSHDLYSNYIRELDTQHVTKEKSPKRETWRGHKTRNSEIENISRRTTVIMRHEVFVSQLFLNNGSPSFTLKLVAADYDIQYFVLIWSRWYIFSNIDRFRKQ